MPFFETDRGPVYYRHWDAAHPAAAVVFLHGFGENVGLYDRYGFALNAAGIDLWAVDQYGHGLSPGKRGRLGTLEDSSALADRLTTLAETTYGSGIPLVAQGHSYGAVVTLFRLLQQPGRYQAGVISGAPLVPIPDLMDANTALEQDPAALSSDPFYLDLLATDPLGFVDGDSIALTRELDRGWDRFGAELPALTVPTLALHGQIDTIAVPGAVRAYAEQIPALRYREFPGARHDILNETCHREVADAVVTFLREQTPSPHERT